MSTEPAMSNFLLARIAEDEAAAKRAAAAKRVEYSHGPAGTDWVARDGMVHRADIDPEVDDSDLWDNEGMDWRLVPEHVIAEHFARWDPARVLAECEAKRRIVERHTKCGTGSGYCDDGGHGWVDDPELGCADLADLALPHAGHPDYRDEWRP